MERNKKGRRTAGTMLMVLGVVLVLGAFLLTQYNIYTDYKAGQDAAKALLALDGEQGDKYGVQSPLKEMPTKEINGFLYVGTLSLPELGLDLPVMDSWSYNKLRLAPCRYSGNVYADTLIIAAHNYRSHFGKLKKLEKGDKVRFTDVDGNKFNYVVESSELLKPTDIEKMETGDWDLTLFTCTPGGASRVTIRCNRVDKRETY